ncbi:MAG TPA: CBS domain-containing protein, partial [Polyangia bacterium]|nr:CBS domain-containing protein [Polyangia bacterium]
AVAAWMRPTGQVATTHPNTRRDDADTHAHRAAVHELLVLDDKGILVGVVCRCDLRPPAATVAECMPSDLYVTGPATPLAEAAAAMRALSLSCLPVVSGALVIGVIARADLARAGARDPSEPDTCPRRCAIAPA